MQRLLIAGGILVLVALTVYSLVDAIITENRRVRGLPKAVWVLVILFLPVVGALLWLTIGKERVAPNAARGGQMAPDDDAAFLFKLNKDLGDAERLRQLEEELKRLDEESNGDEQPK
ncbi:MAG: PLD nuclease N-terminal domain-containing protein [Microbacteriaceae bacterium]